MFLSTPVLPLPRLTSLVLAPFRKYAQQPHWKSPLTVNTKIGLTGRPVSTHVARPIRCAPAGSSRRQSVGAKSARTSTRTPKAARHSPAQSIAISSGANGARALPLAVLVRCLQRGQAMKRPTEGGTAQAMSTRLAAATCNPATWIASIRLGETGSLALRPVGTARDLATGKWTCRSRSMAPSATVSRRNPCPAVRRSVRWTATQMNGRSGQHAQPLVATTASSDAHGMSSQRLPKEVLHVDCSRKTGPVRTRAVRQTASIAPGKIGSLVP